MRPDPTFQSRKVLFVCTGNICRSLMAERLALKLARERGLALEARSCGVAAESYYRPPKEVSAALAPLGVDAEGHAAQLVGRELLRWCDVALTMTQAQRGMILDAYPEFTRKVFVLRAYAGLDDGDVADPIGRPQAVYDACRDELLGAVSALIARWA
ncbi:MAG: low molecular weight protein arginine phosphatase [Elusimicrobia bacterium]|nr:low molecular weight protein arginine phosphatase [Elusimicrobiota bacterium]MDE2236927.1 low molecular weight protein arginine phosphatase [Elusimicrobiota bacterium]MDE2427050.1 low molecular weight protein arginine phosphatase [Elusimicrobiota bacterium]